MKPIYADSETSDAALDAALHEVAETYRRNLPPGTLQAFPVDGLDRLNLPVEVASFTLPADEKTGTPDRVFDGFGYGLTRAEATVGALGELTEAAHSEVDLPSRDFVTGSYVEMVNQFGAGGVCDPLTLCLPAGSDYTPDTPLEWTEAVRYRTGERVFLPTEFAAVYGHQMRGREPMIVTITNGLGAGLTRDQALSHGVLELLQRDGNCTTFRAMDEGVVIEPDEVRDASLLELLDTLTKAGLEVVPKLASTEFGLSNVYVVGRDAAGAGLPIQTTACGEASHLDRERALRKAMIEFAAARSRKAFMHGPLELIDRVSPDWYLPGYLESFDFSTQEKRATDAMIAWMQMSQTELESVLSDTVFSDRRRVKLSELPTVEPAAIRDPSDRMDAVARRLEAESLEVLVIDHTPPGQSEVSVVRGVVPGLEGETMSYGRLGERGAARLLARGESFVGLGPASGPRLRVPLTADAEERLGGPVWFDPEAAAARVGQHYALYREPKAHTVPVAMGQTLDR